MNEIINSNIRASLNPGERMRWIAGLENKFAITSHGRIWDAAAGEWRASRTGNHGYKVISLNGMSVLVHRLVLRTFDREPREGEQTAHADGDRSNNRIENLSWATPLANGRDKVRHGTSKRAGRRPEITAQLMAEMRAAYVAGGVTQKALAERYGVSLPTAARHCGPAARGEKRL